MSEKVLEITVYRRKDGGFNIIREYPDGSMQGGVADEDTTQDILRALAVSND